MQSVNNNDDLQTADNSIIMTPSTQQKIDFIATPTVLYINNDYDLRNISDLEGFLHSIEKQNISQDIVTTKSEERPVTPIEPLTKKRKIDPNLWKDRKNKILKNSGKSYESVRTKKQNVEKSIGPPCNCKLKCFEKIQQNMRNKIFQNFWAIGDHERQWDFINRHVKKDNVKKITVERKNNRTQTLTYQLLDDSNSMIKVCKTMFLSTLSITQQVVYTAIDKLGDDNYLKDYRGTHKNRPRRMSEETEKSIIDHINLFERVESHYTRKDSQKQYLCETLNVSKMHRLYLEWIDTNHQYNQTCKATKRQYEIIFNTKFNLSFHKPKKDLCEICSIYHTSDDVRKEQLKADYEKHLKEKQMVRQLKEQEKEKFCSDDSVVACFDLEKVLNIPQSEVSIFHYKRKYPVYNFTIYNILEKKGYCYVWHCQIAKRGAIEIARCLWSFIQAHVELGIKNISFYSDSCAGQNRNRFVFAMFSLAAKKYNIKITHRFLEKGHSQSEGDSMHAAIERSKKKHTIYTPDQMYSLIENAKVTGHKFQVKQMMQADFIDFKELIKGKNWLKDTDGNKIYWSKIKEVVFPYNQPDTVYFRYSFEDELQEMQAITRTNSRRRRGDPIEDAENLKLAYTGMLPIPLPLYRDLISLCDSGAIPNHYQCFYRNLVPLNSTSITNDSDEENY